MCVECLLNCERFGGIFEKTCLIFLQKYLFLVAFLRTNTHVNEVDKVSKDDLKALSSDEVHSPRRFLYEHMDDDWLLS